MPRLKVNATANMKKTAQPVLVCGTVQHRFRHKLYAQWNSSEIENKKASTKFLCNPSGRNVIENRKLKLF